MNTKHTPGPWRIEVGDADGARALQWPTIQSESREIVGTEGFYGDIEEDIANARLAAAAPELLEALETLVAMDDCGMGVTGWDHGFNKARAAIAKATGSEA